MSGLYFEEFEIGQVFRHRMRRTITEADMVRLHADLVLGGLGVATTDAARTGGARPPGPDKPKLVARN